MGELRVRSGNKDFLKRARGWDGALDRQMYVTAAPCKPFRRIRCARGLDKLIVASCARDDSSCSSCDAARQQTNRIWLLGSRIPFPGLATSHAEWRTQS